MDVTNNRFYRQKPEIPKTKAEFAAMLAREYGYSEKLAKDCAGIVADHGAFGKNSDPLRCNATVPYPNGKKRRCQHLAKNAGYCKQHQSKELLREVIVVPGLEHIPCYSDYERDGMLKAFTEAQQYHGIFESLFAVASFILRARGCLPQPPDNHATRDRVPKGEA
jgi:hypothetical protein